ncbi:ArsR/SmtB family transcription factor [Arthrobacter sp. TWP1-1]|uniref:ArsR/SmtB family transcription factor n=1 Tax=Arthrobacter sp. TWP1-1 TaxID=2804568 RepID=UPI003CE97F77
MVAEKVFAVIAESTRRDILEALAQESKAVGQLVDELGVSQPTVSKHLRVLREAGVVTMRAQGQKRFYGINTEPLAMVSTWLDSLGAGAAIVSTAAVSANGTPVNGAQANSASANGTQANGVKPVEDAKKPLAPASLALVSVPPASVPDNGHAARPSTKVQTAPATNGTGTVKDAASGAPAVVAPAVKAAPVHVASSQVATIVHSNDVDGGVQSQLSRSVGRAANKAADLLANLPTLPTFKRRKN